MITYALIAIPLSLFWMGITNILTLESFLVGFVLSMAGLVLFRPKPWSIAWHKLPGQLIALVVYIVMLYRDILLSGVDLARRIFSRDMRLKPGIIAVPIQDPEKRPIIAALSSDIVTLTPGELVVEIEDNSVMYVHCLDIEKAEAEAVAEQARRLKLLQRILGR